MSKQEPCVRCIYNDWVENKPCQKKAFRVGSEKPECFNFIDISLFDMSCHDDRKDK